MGTVRPTLLFVTAYMATMTSHEIAHAVMAYQLGFASTIFQLWVRPEAANATPAQIATIAAAGPVFSLVIGALGWIGYRSRPAGPSSLGFLMLGLMGTYAFLGPLVGAALGGDGNMVLRALDAPPAIRLAISIGGGIALAAFMFSCGKLLVRNVPPDVSRLHAVFSTVMGPWVIGTALAVLLYTPLPRQLILSTIGGSGFWLFAAIGAALDRDAPRVNAYSIRSADVGLVIATLLVVRVLTDGVRLTP